MVYCIVYIFYHVYSPDLMYAVYRRCIVMYTVYMDMYTVMYTTITCSDYTQHVQFSFTQLTMCGVNHTLIFLWWGSCSCRSWALCDWALTTERWLWRLVGRCLVLVVWCWALGDRCGVRAWRRYERRNGNRRSNTSTGTGARASPDERCLSHFRRRTGFRRLKTLE
jgi:hypothetical protein